MYLEILKNLSIFPLFMSIFGCMLYNDKAHSRYNVNIIILYTYAITLVYTVIPRGGVGFHPAILGGTAPGFQGRVALGIGTWTY